MLQCNILFLSKLLVFSKAPIRNQSEVFSVITFWTKMGSLALSSPGTSPTSPEWPQRTPEHEHRPLVASLQPSVTTLYIPATDSSTPMSAVLPPAPPMSVCTQPGCSMRKVRWGCCTARHAVSMFCTRAVNDLSAKLYNHREVRPLALLGPFPG